MDNTLLMALNHTIEIGTSEFNMQMGHTTSFHDERKDCVAAGRRSCHTECVYSPTPELPDHYLANYFDITIDEGHFVDLRSFLLLSYKAKRAPCALMVLTIA